MMAQHPQELQPFIIGRQADPQPVGGVGGDFADQQAGGKHPAIAGTDHPVAGAHLIGVFQKVDQRCCGIVTRHQHGLARRLDMRRNRTGRVGQQDHPGGGLADARNTPHQPEPVHCRPAIPDAIARAHVQQHRLAERRTAIGQHHAGDKGQARVQTHIVEVQQTRVFLFQLQRGLFPGLHLAQFAAQFTVLVGHPLIALKVAQQVDGGRDRCHGPVHVGHHVVGYLRAKLLDPRAVDPPDQENSQQAQDDNPENQTTQGGCVILML